MTHQESQERIREAIKEHVEMFNLHRLEVDATPSKRSMERGKQKFVGGAMFNYGDIQFTEWEKKSGERND